MLRRRLLPLLALPVLAPVLAGCSATAPSALEVNGGSLSRDQLQSDLKALQSNPDFVKLLSGQGMSLTGGPKDPATISSNNQSSASDKAWNADIVASWLTRELYSVAIHQEIKDLKIEVPPATTDQKNLIYGDFGGKEVFEKFPKDFQARLLRYYQELDALTGVQKKSMGSPEDYYAKNPSEFPASACVSHILVSTEAEANAAKARLTKGEDFAKVAGEVSTDTGSKAQGGDLGCTQLSSYVKEFADAAAKLPLNVVSDPVKSSFGYHLIKVTKRDEPKFDAKVVDAAMQKKAESAAVDALLPQLDDAKVDPRFGTVQAGAAGSGPRVIAPGQDNLP